MPRSSAAALLKKLCFALAFFRIKQYLPSISSSAHTHAKASQYHMTHPPSSSKTPLARGRVSTAASALLSSMRFPLNVLLFSMLFRICCRSLQALVPAWPPPPSTRLVTRCTLRCCRLAMLALACACVNNHSRVACNRRCCRVVPRHSTANVRQLFCRFARVCRRRR